MAWVPVKCSDDSFPIFSGIPLLWIKESDIYKYSQIFQFFLLFFYYFLFLSVSKKFKLFSPWSCLHQPDVCFYILVRQTQTSGWSRIFNMAWFILPGHDVKVVDKSVKNAWKWHWLSRVVEQENISENIRNTIEPGIARCIMCNKDI